MVYAIDLADPAQNPVAKFSSISQMLSMIISLVTIFGSLAVLAMFLYGGYMWLTAGEAPDKVAKAQKTFTYAIVGFMLMIFAYFITHLLATVFGVTLPF